MRRNRLQTASPTDRHQFRDASKRLAAPSLTSSSLCLLSFMAPELRSIFLQAGRQAGSSGGGLSLSLRSTSSLTAEKYSRVGSPKENITLSRCIQGGKLQRRKQSLGSPSHSARRPSVFVHYYASAVLSMRVFHGENFIKVPLRPQQLLLDHQGLVFYGVLQSLRKLQLFFGAFAPSIMSAATLNHS